VIHRVRQSNFT